MPNWEKANNTLIVMGKYTLGKEFKDGDIVTNFCGQVQPVYFQRITNEAVEISRDEGKKYPGVEVILPKDIDGNTPPLDDEGKPIKPIPIDPKDKALWEIGDFAATAKGKETDGDVIVWGINYGEQAYGSLYDSLKHIRTSINTGFLAGFQAKLTSAIRNASTKLLGPGNFEKLLEQHAYQIIRFCVSSEKVFPVSKLKEQLKNVTFFDEKKRDEFCDVLNELRKPDGKLEKIPNYKGFVDNLSTVASILQDRIKMSAIALYVLSGFGKTDDGHGGLRDVLEMDDLDREIVKFYVTDSTSQNFVKRLKIDYGTTDDKKARQAHIDEIQKVLKQLQTGYKDKEKSDTADMCIEKIIDDYRIKIEPHAKVSEEDFQQTVAVQVFNKIFALSSPGGEKVIEDCSAVLDDYYKGEITREEFINNLKKAFNGSFDAAYEAIKVVGTLTTSVVTALKKVAGTDNGMMFLPGVIGNADKGISALERGYWIAIKEKLQSGIELSFKKVVNEIRNLIGNDMFSGPIDTPTENKLEEFRRHIEQQKLDTLSICLERTDTPPKDELLRIPIPVNAGISKKQRMYVDSIQIEESPPPDGCGEKKTKVSDENLPASEEAGEPPGKKNDDKVDNPLPPPEFLKGMPKKVEPKKKQGDGDTGQDQKASKEPLQDKDKKLIQPADCSIDEEVWTSVTAELPVEYLGEQPFSERNKTAVVLYQDEERLGSGKTAINKIVSLSQSSRDKLLDKLNELHVLWFLYNHPQEAVEAYSDAYRGILENKARDALSLLVSEITMLLPQGITQVDSEKTPGKGYLAQEYMILATLAQIGEVKDALPGWQKKFKICEWFPAVMNEDDIKKISTYYVRRCEAGFQLAEYIKRIRDLQTLSESAAKLIVVNNTVAGYCKEPATTGGETFLSTTGKFPDAINVFVSKDALHNAENAGTLIDGIKIKSRKTPLIVFDDQSLRCTNYDCINQNDFPEWTDNWDDWARDKPFQTDVIKLDDSSRMLRLICALLKPPVSQLLPTGYARVFTWGCKNILKNNGFPGIWTADDTFHIDAGTDLVEILKQFWTYDENLLNVFMTNRLKNIFAMQSFTGSDEVKGAFGHIPDIEIGKIQVNKIGPKGNIQPVPLVGLSNGAGVTITTPKSWFINGQ